MKNASVLGDQYSIRDTTSHAGQSKGDGKLPMRTRVLILAGAGLGAWALVGLVGYGLYAAV